MGRYTDGYGQFHESQVESDMDALETRVEKLEENISYSCEPDSVARRLKNLEKELELIKALIKVYKTLLDVQMEQKEQ